MFVEQMSAVLKNMDLIIWETSEVALIVFG